MVELLRSGSHLIQMKHRHFGKEKIEHKKDEEWLQMAMNDLHQQEK